VFEYLCKPRDYEVALYSSRSKARPQLAGLIALRNGKATVRNKEKRRPDNLEARAPRLWIQHAATVLLLIVLIAIMVATGVKLHETLFLPRNYKNLDKKALAQIQKDYTKFESEFINLDKSTHGYSVVVWADNHSSRKTFGQLIKKINKENDDNTAEWNQLKDRLARLKTDTTIAKETRDRMVAELEKEIDEVHKQHLLFAVNSGDLAYDGDVTKYRLTLQVADKLKIPMVTAIGNHDIRSNGRKAYREVWGPFTYSFSVGNAYYIMLDDANEKRVDPAQMKWFEAELKKSLPYNYCFVDMHVPPFKGQRNQNAPMDKFLADRKNAQAIKDLATKYHVTFVLAGHIHTYDADEWPIPPGAPMAGMSPVRAAQQYTGFIISGGAGARLWKVDTGKNSVMSRARYHYFDVTMNAEVPEVLENGQVVTKSKTGFRRQEINPTHADAWYTFEETWVCIYAKIANLYPWEMLVLVPVFILLLAYLVLDERRRNKGTPGGPEEKI